MSRSRPRPQETPPRSRVPWFPAAWGRDLIPIHCQARWTRPLAVSRRRPSFTATLEYSVTETLGLEEHIAEYRKILEQYPERKVRLLDATNRLDLEHGLATVYIDLERTGFPPGVVQTVIAVYEWQLVKQKWLCSKMIGMRGSGSGK